MSRLQIIVKDAKDIVVGRAKEVSSTKTNKTEKLKQVVLGQKLEGQMIR